MPSTKTLQVLHIGKGFFYNSPKKRVSIEINKQINKQANSKIIISGIYHVDSLMSINFETLGGVFGHSLILGCFLTQLDPLKIFTFFDCLADMNS